MSRMTCPRRMNELGGWERTEGLDRIDEDRTCSFCGSLTGDAFMERVRAGETVSPTDKNFKAYLDQPWAKFYFQHLTVEQQREFIDLINARRVVIGYPGRFDVLPFFATVDA